MNKAEIERAIAELTEQLKELEALEASAAKAALNAIVMQYDYTVQWLHPALFRIERTVTKETAQAIAQFKEQFPNAPDPKPFVGGMKYSLLEGGYVHGHSGAVVVQWGGEHLSSFDPQPVAPDIIAALKAGIVPDSIKRS